MSRLSTLHDRTLSPHVQEIHDRELDGQDAEIEKLQKENGELLARIEEMEQTWLDGQREYENLLEEKSEVIRGLHQKIQELQERGPAPADTPNPEEAQAVQKEIEEGRQRLHDDEESLMVQMREMELAMARERAELARQRTELQRLQAEFNREVELASRDAELRDRLSALQRRQQAFVQRRQEQPESSRQGNSAHTPAPSEDTPLPRKNSSGLLKRLFGK